MTGRRCDRRAHPNKVALGGPRSNRISFTIHCPSRYPRLFLSSLLLLLLANFLLLPPNKHPIRYQNPEQNEDECSAETEVQPEVDGEHLRIFCSRQLLRRPKYEQRISPKERNRRLPAEDGHHCVFPVCSGLDLQLVVQFRVICEQEMSAAGHRALLVTVYRIPVVRNFSSSYFPYNLKEKYIRNSWRTV